MTKRLSPVNTLKFPVALRHYQAINKTLAKYKNRFDFYVYTCDFGSKQ